MAIRNYHRKVKVHQPGYIKLNIHLETLEALLANTDE